MCGPSWVSMAQPSLSPPLKISTEKKVKFALCIIWPTLTNMHFKMQRWKIRFGSNRLSGTESISHLVMVTITFNSFYAHHYRPSHQDIIVTFVICYYLPRHHSNIIMSLKFPQGDSEWGRSPSQLNCFTCSQCKLKYLVYMYLNSCELFQKWSITKHHIYHVTLVDCAGTVTEFATRYHSKGPFTLRSI